MARLHGTGCARCHSPLLRQHWVFPTHHLFLPFSVGRALLCTGAWQPAAGSRDLAALSAQLLEDEAKPCPRCVFWREWKSCGEDSCTSHSSSQWPRCWLNRCHLEGDHQGDAQNVSETQVMPCSKEPGCPCAFWLFTGCKAASAVLEHIPLAAVIHCQKYIRTDGSNCVFLCAVPSVMAHCYLILLGEVLYASSTAWMKD